MNNNLAAKFDFRGFRLLKADFNHLKDAPISSFSMATRKQLYEEKNQIYELLTEIVLNYGDEKCTFVFSSGFKVNDLEWLEIMAEATIINEMFMVVFPFFRNKVQEFTSDFRPGFIIPVFDMRKFDFSKKINFNLEQVKRVVPNAKNDNDIVN